MVLLRNLSASSIKYLNSVTHEGKVVVFATDVNGKIWYTIKQDGFEDSYLNTPAAERTGWENWQELAFPDEAEDLSVINREKLEFTDRENPDRFVIRSLYKTGDRSAVAPVQAISALDHVYVFRQSKSNTLLVDRFVLDAMTNKLIRKYEVRFKRSRQKYTPTKNMTKGSGGLSNVDTLDFRDTNNNFFYEPTTELSLVNNLQNGWFSVVSVPTIENDVYRWHIFAYNRDTRKVELTTLRASEEGLFEVRDYNFFEQDKESPELRKIPGVIKRTLDTGGLKIINGLSATKYDIQQEQETQSGDKQLLRMETRLMLVVATDKGAVSLSFHIAKDGLLAEADSKGISENRQKTIRARIQELLLPITVLDEVKAFADLTPPPHGKIVGLEEGTKGDGVEDLVTIVSDHSVGLDSGDLVTIDGNEDYQGFYRPKVVDKDRFEVELPRKLEHLGSWDKQEAEGDEGGFVFDGMITAYKVTPEGKLQVTCKDHGIEDGDEVHIIGTDSYNHTYPIRKIDDTHFAIEKKWPAGEVLDMRVLGRKRRGIVFDGVDDYIELPEMRYSFFGGMTVEAWVWYDGFQPSSRIIDFSDGSIENSLVLGNRDSSNDLTLTVYVGASPYTLAAKGVLETGQWIHLAATIDASGNAKLYKNGVEIQAGQMEKPPTVKRGKNYLARSSTANNGYFQGKISDLRLWTTARTGEEIKNSMYLQLTGQETYLVGYWRLSGIADRTVPDFGVHVNDGQVYGDPYVSATLLKRALNNGTKAVKYSNPELVAVSRRTVYEESFEFKVNPANAVSFDASGNVVDGQGKPIFTFAYWGKLSRSAEDKIVIKIKDKARTFEDLGNGWYRAACRVTIPDGVSMLRCFEIAKVSGDWESLEIRKHRIASVSNSITEASYTQNLSNLKSLADNQATLSAKLRQISPKEQQLIVAFKERQDLLKMIASLEMPNDLAIQQKQAEIANQQAQVNSAAGNTNYWREESNYSRQQAIFYDSSGLQGRTASYGLGQYSGSPFYVLGSVRVEPGLKAILKIYSMGGNNSEMTITRDDGVLFSRLMGPLPGFMQVTGIEIQTKNGNRDPNAIQAAFNDAQTKESQQRNLLNKLQGELDNLRASEASRVEQLRKCKERLPQVNTLITQLETELNTLHSDLLSGVQKNRTTPQVMPEISEDERGLVINGALLDFVQPASRIDTLETCEGNVQLSYFDSDGRMRQTNFDATADSRNAAFEQWIPDSLRACLNFAGKDSRVTLTYPIALPENWTIETWFVYPLPETPDWNTLARGKVNHFVLVKNGKQLGFFCADPNGILGESFYPIDFDMQTLSAGWHHLAAVAREDTQVFYIDGKKVGDTKSKALADAPKDSQRAKDLKAAKIKLTGDVLTFGGFTYAGNGQPFGKLAELRFWGVALNDDEIAMNSKTVLSGNEPGLLAYYPLDEATGDTVRNGTGFANDGKVSNLSDRAVSNSLASAPASSSESIGLPVNKVLKFDGVNDAIRVPDHANLQITAYTVEVWIKPKPPSQEWTGIIGKPGRNFNIWLHNNGFIHHRFHTPSSTGDGIPNTPNGSVRWDEWNHIAITNDGKIARTYINGSLAAEGFVSSGLIVDKTPLYIACNLDSGQSHYFNGSMTEARIWKVARSQAEIQADMNKRLIGKEGNLAAYYPLVEGINQQVVDLVTNNPGTLVEAVSVEDRALPIGLPVNQVLKFDGVNDSIKTELKNLSGNEITVEYWFKGKTLQSVVRQQQGNNYLISGWQPSRPLHILSWDGSTSAGLPVGDAATDGNWHHVAVTWKRNTPNGFVSYLDGVVVGQRNSADAAIPATNESVFIGSYLGVSEFTEGQLAEVRIWNKARSATEIRANMNTRLTGKEANLIVCYPLDSVQTEGFTRKVLDLSGNYPGTVFEAILVENRALPLVPPPPPPPILPTSWVSCTAPIGHPVWKTLKFDGVNDHVRLPEMSADFSGGFTVEAWVWYDSFKNCSRIIDLGNDAGSDNILLANSGTSGRLSFNIYRGSTAQETITPNAVLEIGRWIHLAATIDGAGNVKLYKNGQEIHSAKVQPPNSLKRTKNYIARSNWSADSYFNGRLSEIRLWNKARSGAEIQADLNTRLSGKEANLIACYPLDRIQVDGPTSKVLDLVGNYPGTVTEALLVDDNTLPIAHDALISAEYSTVTIDPVTGAKVGLMRRFLAYPASDSAELLADKRVEALELKWIGNAQYAPTLLGYIEGSPPIPSENLTVQDDYNGATSVELVTSEDVSYSWNRSQESGLGSTLEAGLGAGGSTSILTAPLGVGTAIDIEIKAKAKMNFDFNYQFTNATNITSSSSLSVTDKLELRGTPEETPHFPHLGNRFIPKNIGYALVVSALADVFITRLARSGKMIGYQVQPVEGIPPDVNTITFLMNPAYTMNGSLDGLTGTSPTSTRFFRQVSEMRAQYGSLYPASYYRLKEAYNLKQAIENEDKRREAYFANFDVRTVDEASLDRGIDSGDAPGSINLQREEDKPGATADDKAAAQNQRVEEANKQAEASAGQGSEEAKKKQAEIQSKIGDREKQAHATVAFAGWQKRMEALQIKAGKRNIVNTYVWDADGGLRTEQQSFANTVEHTIGGSFSMNAAMGIDLDVEAFGIAVNLTAQATVNLTQTMTKTLASSKGFQLNVDLNGVECKGITNYKDLPVMPGEKVDRYRFMSFYLEGSTNNFADFFNYVVDPEWLASNDEEARALRQTQAGKPNKAWRILHRVTYVERPALMGFGRDVRPVESETLDRATSEVVQYFEQLDRKQRLLEAKMDEILTLLKRK
ncbi:LamG-like jellyroll fold domain-containing protein [Pannus brasiliensis CCIBt3594]|uniref:LamG-like jellyroll fold domain-containing protein n=1 Tax=Pannus brasiliensis CCIBt3594 TaxID=1427578 RepID=A0AAW9QZJ4_9CHRO